MTTEYKLQLKTGASRNISRGRDLYLNYMGGTVHLGSSSPETLRVLDRLTDGTSEASLKQEFQTCNWVVLLKIHDLIERLSCLGLIESILVIDGSAIGSYASLSSETTVRATPIEVDTPYQLSRFVYCRSDQGKLLLESLTSFTQILLFNWQGGAIVSELSRPITYRELAEQLPIQPSVIQGILAFLLGAEFLITESDHAPHSRELERWEFHDLLFHTRSRLGRYLNPMWEEQVLEAPPPMEENRQRSTKTIPLYIPDPDILKSQDIPLTQVLESRRSRRQHSCQPLTHQQLGELLYRSTRAIQTTSHGIRRLYPSMCGLNSIELYAAVNQCQGLNAGFYHYSPDQHHLELISEYDNSVCLLLNQARIFIGQEHYPQILIILSAKFHEIHSKRNSRYYALILKEVGAIYQTIYLVATAMDLACCALGSGDSDLFAKVAKTDYYSESSVGELAIGLPSLL